MSSDRVILLFICVILLPQAGILLYTNKADGCISSAAIIHFFGDSKPIAIAFLLLTSITSILAVVLKRFIRPQVRMVLLIPQLIALLIYASGALDAILRQNYADNDPHPWSFIFNDQLPLVAVFIAYCMSFIDI